MYPDSVSRVHFLFVLIYGKSGFFIKFVKTYSISIKMGEHICFRRNERLATAHTRTEAVLSVKKAPAHHRIASPIRIDSS